MDKWGNGATTNSDKENNRFWVTKKLDLYGKWKANLTGADGIGVLYDANGGSNAPTDTHLYVDHAEATAGAAATAPEGMQFLHWVVQKYNTQTEKYEDTNTTVYPGDIYDVLKANAKVVENAGSTSENPSFTYTVQLRAEYGPTEAPTPTHITWYANNGTDEKVEDKGDDNNGLHVNEAVNIKPADTFTYPVHKFLGWARLEEGQRPTEDTELWLVYDEATNSFTHDGTAATQVAADERTPYHDLYAMWEEEEVTIEYKVASDCENMGAVSPASETIKAVTGTASGSTATPAETYVFDY